MIDQLDASGLSVADFCAAEGVPAPSVYHWRRKLRDNAQAEAEASPPRLVRLEPVPAGWQADADADAAVAELTSGDRVRVPVARLPELVAALRSTR